MTQTAPCTTARASLPWPPLATDAEATAFIKDGQVPRRLECPINLAPMHDPVSLDGHGHVFERSALAQALSKGPPFKNPCTNAPIEGVPRCTPRFDLREDYDAFRAAVLAQSPAQGRALPTGPRRPAGPLVDAPAADRDFFAAGPRRGTTRPRPLRTPRAHRPAQFVRLERPVTAAEAGLAVGAGCGACVAACGLVLVAVPVVCAIGIVLAPVNAALRCAGVPPVTIRLPCARRGPPVIE